MNLSAAYFARRRANQIVQIVNFQLGNCSGGARTHAAVSRRVLASYSPDDKNAPLPRTDPPKKIGPPSARHQSTHRTLPPQTSWGDKPKLLLRNRLKAVRNLVTIAARISIVKGLRAPGDLSEGCKSRLESPDIGAGGLQSRYCHSEVGRGISVAMRFGKAKEVPRPTSG